MIDSYQTLFDNYLSKEDLFRFGLSNSIFIPKDQVAKSWDELKLSIISDREVHIRGYGRNGSGTNLFVELYSSIFSNLNVVKDPTNNASPRRILQNLTDLRINQDLRNYQTAHVFGRTKNPYPPVSG